MSLYNYIPKPTVQEILDENGVKPQQPAPKQQPIVQNQPQRINKVEDDDDEVFEEENIEEEF